MLICELKLLFCLESHIEDSLGMDLLRSSDLGRRRNVCEMVLLGLERY